MTEVVEKKGLINFLKETRLETKKVSWPTRTEVTSSTLVILIIMIFFGFLIGGMDSVLSQTVKYLLQMF
jgi:preprotein translocase subunit SecE